MGPVMRITLPSILLGAMIVFLLFNKRRSEVVSIAKPEFQPNPRPPEPSQHSSREFHSGPHSDHASDKASASGGKYEVFLSFRGEDTRYGFTDHLYNDLVEKGIRTFRDEEELRPGEEIRSELPKAIKESKIFIPIFSRDYASSDWCLNELAQMVESKRTMGQKILPIFYYVKPSDVEHQTGSYEEAFRHHEKYFDEKTVQRWKEALREVVELKGWELKKEMHEGELVKEVVEEVLLELKKNHVQILSSRRRHSTEPLEHSLDSLRLQMGPVMRITLPSILLGAMILLGAVILLGAMIAFLLFNKRRSKVVSIAKPKFQPNPRPPKPSQHSPREFHSGPYSHHASDKASASGGTYEVFLSFRGKDTRYGFTDHLYNNLVKMGFHTFRAEGELRHGEEICSELSKAIKESKIFIPIFSRDYASSKCCLKEFAQMVECKRTMGQKILPIFYYVKPSDVKHQTGSYGKAFRQHEIRFDEETVHEWKEALREVAELKGWELKKEMLEGELVKKVVEEVLLQKNPTDNLVEIDYYVEETTRRLYIRFSNDMYGLLESVALVVSPILVLFIIFFILTVRKGFTNH